jgi:hypothetical protein
MFSRSIRFGRSEALWWIRARPDLGRHVDDHREVRHDVAHGEPVDLVDRVGGQVAPDPLVHGRRVEVAVAENDRAPHERRRDHLAHELRPRRGEEQQLGLGAHLVALGIMDDDVADLLPDLGSARLAHGDHVALQLLEALGEARDLRGLPAALGALERDEFAGVS